MQYGKIKDFILTFFLLIFSLTIYLISNEEDYCKYKVRSTIKNSFKKKTDEIVSIGFFKYSL